MVKYEGRDPPGHNTSQQSPILSAEDQDMLRNTHDLRSCDDHNPTVPEWTGASTADPVAIQSAIDGIYKVCYILYVTLGMMIHLINYII